MTTEMKEETRETLHVLELDRTPRPQKLAAERAYFDGAHEVRFTERSFRPKKDAPLDDIRAFVDSLEVRRREAPVPPLPQAPPTSVPVNVAPKIPAHYREPLEAVIRGALISVDTVHRVGTGTVVDVAWESEDEGERRGLYVIENDVARPFDAVASSVDELPPPRIEAEAPSASQPEPQPKPEPGPEPEPKKRRFGFGKRSKSEPAAEPQPEPKPQPEPTETKKRRFGFGKK